MMVLTIQQIKLSWSELFVIAKSSVLSGLHVVDVAAMRLGDYGSCPLQVRAESWENLVSAIEYEKKDERLRQHVDIGCILSRDFPHS
ncbi:hypothetical protein ACTXT7_015880 [Hymenolepis weldensis]